jgi:tetratricopeptide (TPR) repeat protein
MNLSHSLCVALLLGHSISSYAIDMNEPLCNGRRISAIEQQMSNSDYQKKCYIYARKLIREASAHDYNIGEVEGILETIIKVNPNSAYTRIGSAELYIKKRELNLQTNSFDEIYQEAIIATKLTPVVSESYVTLGMLDLMINCVACAELNAKKAKALGNSGPELAILISSIAEKNNDTTKAIAELTSTLSLARPIPSDLKVEILVRLSKLSAKQKNYIEAENELNKAIAVNPSNPNAYLAKSEFLLFWKGDSTAAVRSAIEANKVKPTVNGKKIQAFSEYLVWAKDYLSGRKASDIKRIIQASIITPEEAFIFSARYNGISQIAEAILKAKILKNIEVQDGQGNTAFITSSIGNNIDLARLLINKHANINARNSSGERALSFWILNKNYDAVSMLLKAGAEINYVDVDGNSPLSIAVFKQDRLLINLLIDHGADFQPVKDLAQKLGIVDIDMLLKSPKRTSI